MSAYSKLAILVDTGGDSAPITVTIQIPANLTGDANEPNAYLSFAESVSRGGFWSLPLSAGGGPGVFYPASSIRAVTPQA